MSPLRERMIEDMILAGLALGTRQAYTQAVRRLGAQQIQAPTPATEWRTRVVGAGHPHQSKIVCPLGISACRRPNIGSRMN